MVDRFNIIEERAEYHVHKKFHRHVRRPLAYILEIIGIDYDDKKGKKSNPKCHIEAAFWGPNEKLEKFISRFLRKRSKFIRKEKLKKKRHEEVEEIV